MNSTASMPLDQYDNALIQYLKRSHHARLPDILAIWGWRCGMEPECISLPHLAEAMLEIVQRFDLLERNDGVIGLYHDASPDQQWRFGIETGNVPIQLATENRAHWVRLIGVLASRLRMAECAKLVGYNHNALVGPFAAMVQEQIERNTP